MVYRGFELMTLVRGCLRENDKYLCHNVDAAHIVAHIVATKLEDIGDVSAEGIITFALQLLGDIEFSKILEDDLGLAKLPWINMKQIFLQPHQQFCTRSLATEFPEVVNGVAECQAVAAHPGNEDTPCAVNPIFTMHEHAIGHVPLGCKRVNGIDGRLHAVWVQVWLVTLERKPHVARVVVTGVAAPAKIDGACEQLRLISRGSRPCHYNSL